MKKQLLLLFLSLLGLSNYAQTYTSKPVDAVPYGNQLYIRPNGEILSGLGSAGFRVVDTKARVDSIAAAKPDRSITAQQISIAGIRSISGALKGNYFAVTDVGKQGNWYYDPSDNSSLDDGSMVLVTADGKRIKRVYQGDIFAEWFGAKFDAVRRVVVGSTAVWYSSLTDTVLATDNTVYIQRALDFIKANKLKSVTLRLPAGIGVIGVVQLPVGVRVLGSGSSVEQDNLASTRLAAKPGANKDIFRFEGTFDGGTRRFWNGTITDVSFFGEPTNTIGRAINLADTLDNPIACADYSSFERLVIRNFPQDGVFFQDSSLPLNFKDSKFLWCNGAGILYQQISANRSQAVDFINISSDGCLNGAIKLKGLDKNGSVNIINLKSEQRINNIYGGYAGQNNAIVIENCDKTPINIVGATHISSIFVSGSTTLRVPPGDLVNISGTGTPKINWMGVAIRITGSEDPALTLPKIINIADADYLTTTGTFFNGSKADIGTSMRIDVIGTSAVPYRSTLNEDAGFVLSGTLPSLSWYENDVASNKKRWGAFASGGTWSLRSILDNGSPQQAISLSTDVSGIPNLQNQFSRFLRITNADPNIEFNDTDGAVGSKVSGFRMIDGELRFFSKNDAFASEVTGPGYRIAGGKPDGLNLRGRIVYSANSGEPTPYVPAFLSSSTIDVSKGNYAITSNATPTTIDNFAGGLTGQEVRLQFGDTLTTLVHGNLNAGGLRLRGGLNMKGSLGDVITFIRATADSSWHEVSRTSAGLLSPAKSILSVDFPNTLQSQASILTFTINGTAVGDIVLLSIPDSIMSTVTWNGNFTAWVSAANTVKIKFSNNDPVSAHDLPATNLTFKVVRP